MNINSIVAGLKSLAGFKPRKAFLSLLAPAMLALPAISLGAGLALVSPGTASGSGALWIPYGGYAGIPYSTFPLYSPIIESTVINYQVFTEFSYTNEYNQAVYNQFALLTWTLGGIPFGSVASNIGFVPPMSPGPVPDYIYDYDYTSCFLLGASTVVGSPGRLSGPLGVLGAGSLLVSVTNGSYLNYTRPVVIPIRTYVAGDDCTLTYGGTWSGGTWYYPSFSVSVVNQIKNVTAYQLGNTSNIGVGIGYQQSRPKKTLFIIRTRTSAIGVRG